MSWAYLLSAAAIGFSAGMTPGPLQAILLSYSIEGGWKKALPAAFAPLLADVVVIPIVLLVLNRLPTFFFTILQFGGAAFMLYLAWESFNAYRLFSSVDTIEVTNPWNTLVKSAAMNLLGPGPWLFWSLINGPNLIRGWESSPWWGLAYLGCFYGVFVISNIGLILIFSNMRRMGEKVRRSLLLVSVFILIGFAIYQVLGGLHVI